MSDTNKQKGGKIVKRGSNRGDTYHGTRLPPAKDTERFTVAEIRRAVDAAIEKNRDILFKRK